MSSSRVQSTMTGWPAVFMDICAHCMTKSAREPRPHAPANRRGSTRTFSAGGLTAWRITASGAGAQGVPPHGWAGGVDLDGSVSGGNGFRVRGGKRGELSSKSGIAGDDGKKHGWHARIHTEFRGSGSLMAPFKAPRVVANDREIV